MKEHIMDQCAAQVREGAFLHDFEVFLDYVEREKIKATPKLGLIPLKHCRNINALFRRPDPIEEKIRRGTFQVQDEADFPRLHFIDFLAGASGCVIVTGQGYLKKGPHLADFRAASLCQKVGALFVSWWDRFPWVSLLQGGGDFAERLQEKRIAIIPILQRACMEKTVDIKEFADGVLMATGARWECEAGDLDNQMARWGVEIIVTGALTYFEAIEWSKIKGENGFLETIAFSIREPLGRWLVSILPLPQSSLSAS
jgi:hypothetical protein